MRFAGAEEAGQPNTDRSIWRVARNILIGETTEQALEHALSGTFARSFDYLIKLMGPGRLAGLKIDPNMPDDEVTPEYMVKNIAIVGDVDEVTGRLQAVWDETGGFGTLLMIAHDWDDKAKWLRSMELLKHEVIPALPTV